MSALPEAGPTRALVVRALLLFGAASGDGAMFDVALTLALLSAFASIAFVKFALRQDQKVPEVDTEEAVR